MNKIFKDSLALVTLALAFTACSDKDDDNYQNGDWNAAGNYANNPDNYYGYGIPDFVEALEMLPLHVDTFMQQNEIIAVFPNPSKGNVHIQMNEGYQAEVNVFDMVGRHLTSYHFKGLNHTSIEHFLNTLDNGVYFIKADSELGSQTIRLVITK